MPGLKWQPKTKVKTMSAFNKLEKSMSEFLQKLEAQIQTIMSNPSGHDAATLNQQIVDTVNAHTAALQTEIDTLKGSLTNDEANALDTAARVADLEKALQDTVDHLTAGNTEDALKIAVDALPVQSDAETGKTTEVAAEGTTDAGTGDAGTEIGTEGTESGEVDKTEADKAE